MSSPCRPRCVTVDHTTRPCPAGIQAPCNWNESEREEHVYREPKLLALSSAYSVGIQLFSRHRQSRQLCRGGWGSSLWLIGSGTVEERRLSAWGAGIGDSPLRSPAPLSPSFSLPLSCANAYPSLMIFGSSSFPSLWSPSSCFPPTLLSLYPSLYLCFSYSLLPHGPSSFILIPLPPWVFNFVFWGFFCSVFFLKVQFHSHKERKK